MRFPMWSALGSITGIAAFSIAGAAGAGASAFGSSVGFDSGFGSVMTVIRCAVFGRQRSGKMETQKAVINVAVQS